MTYLCLLLLVSALVVCLPLIYIAITVGVGVGTFYMAMENQDGWNEMLDDFVDEFYALSDLFRFCNFDVSGRLAKAVQIIEKQHNIQPIKMVLVKLLIGQ